MKMNNTCKFLALVALGSFAGAVLCCSQKSSNKANKFIKAISEVLDNAEVTDFETFSEYLLEYYGITAKNIYGKVVEYSTDTFDTNMTSDDIQVYGKSGYGYDMDDLEMFFSSNRELWV